MKGQINPTVLEALDKMGSEQSEIGEQEMDFSLVGRG
jgi:hypothetical protein